MCRPSALSAWIAELETVFPHLSKPQAKVLAEYSLGMVLAGRCGLSCVAFALARWLGQSFDAVRERLRDWYCGASDKSGRRRRALDVEGCFGPLLAWVLKDWQGDELPVVLDATTLGERFVVLAVCVVYRSCAIPVAWTVLPAATKGAHKPHWKRLLQRFKGLVPPHLTVIVLADRGLYAKWMFKAIVALGWHPFLRINTHNAEFKPDGAAAEAAGEYRPVASLLPVQGSAYAASGTMFRSADARLHCTLLAQWAQGYEEGWFVLTDLPAERARVGWYALRGWVECGFKHTKSGGWNWQDTRMTDPARAARQWLAMALASLLLVREGMTAKTHAATPADADRTQECIEPPPPAAEDPSSAPTATATKAARRRVLSVFRQGLVLIQSVLLANLPLPHGRFIPEPWQQPVTIASNTVPSAHPP